MSPSRLLPLALAAAIGLSALPAGAGTATTLPAYCGKKALVLAEGESLVERTVYLHGTTPAGDADSRVNVDNLFMDATAPTADAPKVKVNASAAANPASNKNSIMAAWTLKLAGESQRIVCATTTFHAVDSGEFGLQLFVDQPRGLEATTAATGTAMGSGQDQVRAFTGSFGNRLDVTASSEVTLQVQSQSAAAMVYDSKAHNGRLTYLTVVKA